MHAERAPNVFGLEAGSGGETDDARVFSFAHPPHVQVAQHAALLPGQRPPRALRRLPARPSRHRAAPGRFRAITQAPSDLPVWCPRCPSADRASRLRSTCRRPARRSRVPTSQHPPRRAGRRTAGSGRDGGDARALVPRHVRVAWSSAWACARAPGRQQPGGQDIYQQAYYRNWNCFVELDRCAGSSKRETDSIPM